MFMEYICVIMLIPDEILIYSASGWSEMWVVNFDENPE